MKLNELAAQNAQLREALEKAFEFMRSGTAEECPDKIYIPAYVALKLPDTSADWLRKHDAGVLKKAASELNAFCIDGKVAAQHLYNTAKELEEQK